MKSFMYPSGEEVIKGDKIIVDLHSSATIFAVVQAHTPEATEWCMEETGGVVVLYSNGSYMTCEYIDEDFELISRAES